MAKAERDQHAADQAALHAFIGEMNSFMATYGQDTAYVSQDPAALIPAELKKNQDIFLTTLKGQINDLNEDHNAWYNPYDSSSDFRKAWNKTAPAKLDLAEEGQDLLAVTPQIDTQTVSILATLTQLKGTFNTQSAQEDQKRSAALTQAAKATLAYIQHFKTDHEPPASKKKKPVEAEKVTTPPEPQGFIYDAQIDNTIPLAIRQRIGFMQESMGLEATGHLDKVTQQALHGLLGFDGRLSDPQNAQIIPALDAQLDRFVEDKREKLRDPLRQKQRDKLKAYNVPADKINMAIQILEGALDVNDAKRQLKQYLSLQGETHKPDSFFNDLWLLEFEKRQWIGGNIIDHISTAEKGQFAVYDVMASLFQSSPGNSLLSKADPHRQDTKVQDDWFFEKEAYPLLRQGKAVDGALLKGDHRKAGTLHDHNTMVDMAYDILLERLNEAGIPAKDLSKALIEGRFTLSAQDLQLVNESFGRPSFQDVLKDKYACEILAMNLQAHLMDVHGFDGAHGTYAQAQAFIDKAIQGDQDALDALKEAYDSAPDFVLSPIIDNYRAQQFNKTFGSFADLHDVTTLRHTALDSDETQEVKSSAAALTLMTIARHGLKRFEKDYGMSAEDAKAALEAAPSLDKAAIPAELRKDITAEMKRFSVVSYFDIGRGDARQNAYSPHQDFQALRDRYTVEHQPEVDPNKGYASAPLTAP